MNTWSRPVRTWWVSWWTWEKMPPVSAGCVRLRLVEIWVRISSSRWYCSVWWDLCFNVELVHDRIGSTDRNGWSAREGLARSPKNDAFSQSKVLFQKGLGLSNGSANIQNGFTGEKPGTDDWMVTDSNTAVVQFTSSPTGAVVLVDGQLLCTETPVVKSWRQVGIPSFSKRSDTFLTR